MSGITSNVVGDEPYVFPVNGLGPHGDCNDVSEIDLAYPIYLRLQFETQALVVSLSFHAGLYNGLDGGWFFYDCRNTWTAVADTKFIPPGNWHRGYCCYLAVFSH